MISADLVYRSRRACRRRLRGARLSVTVGTRDALHVLIDEIPEDDLPLAQDALEAIRRGFEVTDDERRELEERFASCDRGEGVEARAFLRKLRERDAQTAGR
jgi:hypothetical protein